LVICYFVLARSVEVQKPGEVGHAAFTPSAASAATWILIIFGLYFAWDFWTKFVDRPKESSAVKGGVPGWRLVPTIVCVVCAVFAKFEFSDGMGKSQVVMAELSLLLLILLFRAGKDLVSAASQPSERRCAAFLTLALAAGFIVATLWAHSGKIGWLEEFIAGGQPATKAGDH
jgi:hypothetical protein